MNRISTNGSAVSAVIWLHLNHVTSISSNGRAVYTGHVVPSNIVCILEFSYNLVTVLYNFLETGTSDNTIIGRDQLLKVLGFSLYPMSFYLKHRNSWPPGVSALDALNDYRDT